MNEKKNTLLVFIDGLNFDIGISKLKFLNSKNSTSITPGIGFSNNIYPEILCGKTPDEMGYFNEWSPLFTEQKPKSIFLRLLDIFRPSLYINAGIRKLILKIFFKIDYANIPFKYAHFFKPQGSHQFRDLPNDSLLNKFNFEIHDAVETGLKRRIRDFYILDNLKDNLKKNQNYFISLLDLDHTSHVFGTNSKEVEEHLKNIESKLSNIFDEFLALNPDNEIYLFSDHGMVDVHTNQFFEIEEYLGRMNDQQYLYFVDSTYVRIWIYNNDIKDNIVKFLKSRNYGSIVDEEHRSEFGLSNKEYGDIIFRANEGVMFVPNFYGGRGNKAMHGYNSNLKSQQAIFSNITNSISSVKMPKRSKEVFTFLNSRLNDEV